MSDCIFRIFLPFRVNIADYVTLIKLIVNDYVCHARLRKPVPEYVRLYIQGISRVF